MPGTTREHTYRTGAGPLANLPVGMPLFLLQPLLGGLVRELAARHPGLFQRLGAHRNRVFLIDPVDMPALLLFRPNPDNPTLVAHSRSDAIRFDAAISGPLAKLIALVNGAVDGDALFFSRDLTIEGETEAVLALRNAIDNLDLNLFEEIEDMLGPPGLVLRQLRSWGSRLGDAAGGWAGWGAAASSHDPEHGPSSVIGAKRG